MLVPKKDIQYRRESDGKTVAFTPLLQGCEGIGVNEEDATRELQRAVRKHLVGMRDRGEMLPEPFASRVRKQRLIFLGVFVGVIVVLAVLVDALRPGDRVTAFDHLTTMSSIDEVRQAMGPPDQGIDLTREVGYLELKSQGIATIWQYHSVRNLGNVAIYFDRRGQLIGKMAGVERLKSDREDSK